jgi:nicotinate-nucleotide pyrophosphorylase (carboxylating)
MTTPEFHVPDEPRSPSASRSPEREHPLPVERRFADRRFTERHTSRAVTPQVGAPVAADDRIGFPLTPRQLDACVRAALHEDGAFYDVPTIACMRATRRAHGTVIARQQGIVAGVPLAIAAFRLLDPNVAIRVDVDDGDRVERGAVILRIAGLARAMLAAHRVALGLVQRLSGIATLASRYASAAGGVPVDVIATPLGAPGLKQLEAYAARAGSAVDRFAVAASAPTIEITDHHLAAAGSDLADAVRRARSLASTGARIAVECRSLDQVRAAIEGGADVIRCIEMSPAAVRECTALVAGRALVYVSGAVPLDTVPAFARSGIDGFVVSDLVACASRLDLALEFEAM